jgi:hypothetical protein
VTEGFFAPYKYLQRNYTTAVDGVDGPIKYTWKVSPSTSVRTVQDSTSSNTVSITFPAAPTPIKDIKYTVTCTIQYTQDGISCTSSSDYTTVIQHTVYDASRVCNTLVLSIAEWDSTNYDFAEGGPPISNAYLNRRYTANFDSPYIDSLSDVSYAWSVVRKTKIGTNTAKLPPAGTGSQYIVNYTKPNVTYTAPKNTETYTVTCKATVTFAILGGIGVKTCPATATATTSISFEPAEQKPEPDPPVNVIVSTIRDKNVLKLDTIPVTILEFLRQMKTGGTQMRDVIKQDIETYDANNGGNLILNPNLTDAQKNKVLDKILKAQPVGSLIDKYIVYATAWKGVPVLSDVNITGDVLKYSGSSYDTNGILLSTPNSYDTDKLRAIFIKLINEIWTSFQRIRSGGDNKALLRHLIYDLFRAMVLQYTMGGGSIADRAASFVTEFKFCIGDIPIYDIATTNNGVVTGKLHWTKAAGTKDLTFSSPPNPNGPIEKRIARDKDKLSTFIGMPDFSAMLISYAIDEASNPSYPGEG